MKKWMPVRGAFDASKIPLEWIVRVVITSGPVKWEAASALIAALCINSWDLLERKDELPSTVTAIRLWHVCDRETLDLPELTELWTVSSIVLFGVYSFLVLHT